MKPYIGICDFTDPAQTTRLLAHMPSDFSHQLMVGVMMSRKTLNDIPSKWSDVFPKKESLHEIFIEDERVLNTIRYADYEVGINRDLALAETLARVVEYGGPHLGAIQLDMIWPDPEELKIFHETHGIPIVLQVGSNAMAFCGESTLATCARLNLYDDSIEAVLFGRSMGQGKGMDVDLLARYVGVMESECHYLLPAVAGGLGPTSLDLVRSLVSAYPNLSINAQSRLRTSGNALNPINWDMAESYFRQAIAMYQSIEK